MKCQAMSLGSAAYFCSSSGTRFSPKIRWPAAYASLILSMGWLLETATRVTCGGSSAFKAKRFREIDIFPMGENSYKRFSVGKKKKKIISHRIQDRKST